LRSCQQGQLETVFADWIATEAILHWRKVAGNDMQVQELTADLSAYICLGDSYLKELKLGDTFTQSCHALNMSGGFEATGNTMVGALRQWCGTENQNPQMRLNRFLRSHSLVRNQKFIRVSRDGVDFSEIDLDDYAVFQSCAPPGI